jgi:cytochrome c556
MAGRRPAVEWTEEGEKKYMTGKLAVLALLGLAAAGIARADDLNVIELRQSGQDLLSGDFAGIRAVVAAKGDVKTLAGPATAMARWMRSFPSMFPKGSDQGNNTKALPAVWSDNEGFHKVADQFVDAADKLAAAAKAGDVDGVSAQVKAVGEACGACHRTYRAR